MSLNLLFWMIMIVGLLLAIYINRGKPFEWLGSTLVFWILLILIGWKVFGPAVHN